jgi:hypothetical protein
MQAVLFFLIIFALASMIARLGHATLFLRFLIAPSFVGLGILLSHHGLGILRPSTLLGLDLFTQVAISWLAFLLGLRRLAYVNARCVKKSVRFGRIFTTFIVTLALTLAMLWAFRFYFLAGINNLTIICIGIFCATLLIGREPLISGKLRINGYDAAIWASIGAIPLLITVFQVKFDSIQSGVTPLIAGGISAIICSLILLCIIKSESILLETLTLILIAICATSSGLAKWFLVPHVLIAFIIGILSSFSVVFLPFLRDLFLSERPIRMVLMILIGAHLTVSLAPIMVGLSLGVLIYLIRALGFLAAKISLKRRVLFSPFMGTGEVAVLFMASIWFVIPEHKSLFNDLVLFILAAGSVGDILGVARWSIMLRKRLHKFDKI